MGFCCAVRSPVQPKPHFNLLQSYFLQRSTFCIDVCPTFKSIECPTRTSIFALPLCKPILIYVTAEPNLSALFTFFIRQLTDSHGAPHPSVHYHIPTTVQKRMMPRITFEQGECHPRLMHGNFTRVTPHSTASTLESDRSMGGNSHGHHNR